MAAKIGLGNIVIAQSGGPTMVINASLAGAVAVAMRLCEEGLAGRILGARHGVEGLLKGDYVDLTKLSSARLAALLQA